MYHIVSENPESTVVAEYECEKRRAADYQSEAELEKEFIKVLQSQRYEYIRIKSEKS
jgi:type I restriction enzyme R subunit